MGGRGRRRGRRIERRERKNHKSGRGVKDNRVIPERGPFQISSRQQQGMCMTCLACTQVARECHK